MKNRVRIAALSKQRGALTVTTPLIVLLIFFLTVLMLDGARLYAMKREMQAQVNAAAVAAAGVVHTCSSMGSGYPYDLSQVAIEAAKQQGFDCEGCLTVTQGIFKFDEGLAEFQEEANSLASNAVEVVYSRSNVPISALFPAKLGSITLEVSAAAKREVLATFYSQSSALSLETDSSPLLKLVISEVLGAGSVSLHGVSFESLRNTLVDLEDLVADLAEGLSLDDIVKTEVTARAVLQALKVASGATGAAGTSLDELIAAASINTNISLGDIIDVSGSGTVPEGARVSILAVVNSTVFNIAKTLPSGIRVEVPNGLIGSLTGLSNTVLEISIGEAPRIAIAPARQDELGDWIGSVSSADVEIRLLLELDLNLLGLVRARGTLPINLAVGASTADLTKASCARGLFNSVVFSADVYNSFLEADIGGEGGLEVTALFGVLPLVRLDVYSRPAPEPRPDPVSVRFDPLDLHEREPVSAEIIDSGNAVKNALTDLVDELEVVNLELLGLLPLGVTLNGVLAATKGLLVNIIGGVINVLIMPLLDALGVSVGSATIVIADAVQPSPYLIEGDGKMAIDIR